MELGHYNADKAKSQAKAYLSKSIATLSDILGLDTNAIELDQINPHPEGSHAHSAYACLLDELQAYNKLIGE
jgi:hypothetical protein